MWMPGNREIFLQICFFPRRRKAKRRKKRLFLEEEHINIALESTAGELYCFEAIQRARDLRLDLDERSFQLEIEERQLEIEERKQMVYVLGLLSKKLVEKYDC